MKRQYLRKWAGHLILLADKFSALNESSVMGVQMELNEARYAFEAFLDRDKAAWKRIENVNRPTIGDWIV